MPEISVNSNMKKIILLCGLIITTFLQAQKTVIKDTSAYFDNYVQNAIRDWQIPGLAIAVVKDGKVKFKKTYGVRSLNTNEKVDNETLFACASTTKAMTALAMGILVDQGKVQWDDKVAKYIPHFKLSDPFVTADIRVRDLFLHNSGLGNTDFLWTFDDVSGDEIIRRMQFVEPSYGYRAGFIYQNIFYHMAGKVIEEVSGMSWANFVTKHIFLPLGMTHTQALHSWIRSTNVSMPHFVIENKVTEILKDTADRIPAAGSVNSTIDDIVLWMQCMIDSSKYNGGRLVSEKTWITLLQPQTFVTEEGFYPTAQITKPHFTTYALGWFQQDYKGEKLNFHTGSLSGEIAIHGQIPDKKVGVYIFANLDHAEARHALMLKALDVYALGETKDWEKEFYVLYKNIHDKKEAAEKAIYDKRVLNTSPSKSLDQYAGLYKNNLMGSIEIKLENGQLVANNVKLGKGILQHFNYDSFLIVWNHKWQSKIGIQFILSPLGDVKSLNLGEYSFQKQ
ncbi:MAG: serine hydrolase [Chitinophagia bacterium]|nr:serine hydrolase [Chitinophagia bacterium]